MSPIHRRSRPAMLLLGLLGLLLTALVPLTARPAAAADLPGTSSTLGQGGRVGSCYASAGPNYLGVRCITGKSGGAVDIKTPEEILCKGGKLKPGPCEDLPTCWYVPITDSELRSLPFRNTDGEEGITYFWHRCLFGVNDKLQVEPGGVRVDENPQPVNNIEIEGLRELKPGRQTELIETYFEEPSADTKQPPSPAAAASPNQNPRVGVDVSFLDANLTGSSISVAAGDVQLLAVENYIVVKPRGEGRSGKTSPERCERPGGDNPGSPSFQPDVRVGYLAKSGETRENTTKGCWYAYDRSSSDQLNDVYSVATTSHWTVWAKDSGGSGWRRFTSFTGGTVEFDKQGTSPIPVSEVQAINVLPDGVLS